MIKNTSTFISIVAPIHNQGIVIGHFLEEINSIMTTHYLNYEVILIDDGSSDNTALQVREQLQKYKCIRYIRLSRSFGLETAISAGLDTAIGDVIVILRPKVDPAALIPEFVMQTCKTNGVVFGIYNEPEKVSLLYLWSKILFFKLCSKLLPFPLPPMNATIYTAISRQALNAILEIKDKSRYLRIFSALIGYPHEFIFYTSESPQDNSSKGLFQSTRSAIDILVMNSTLPLRYASYLGLLASIFNMFYIIYIFIVNIVIQNVAEGWTTLSLQNSIMFFFLFIIISVLMEYVDRILNETKNRPSYYVAEESYSSVMIIDENYRNIVFSSE
jgi:polyisoprenyl-phosphate glycosyltransferase